MVCAARYTRRTAPLFDITHTPQPRTHDIVPDFTAGHYCYI